MGNQENIEKINNVHSSIDIFRLKFLFCFNINIKINKKSLIKNLNIWKKTYGKSFEKQHKKL